MNYRLYKHCRFCNGKNIHRILNLGNMPLAGGFLKDPSDFRKEKRYPLELYFCKDCLLVQVNTVINKNILFKNYYYSSSSINTLIKHFEDFGKTLRKIYRGKKFIVEIGSNDGIFLKILNKNGFKTLGVDPSVNLTRPLIKNGINVINDFFSEKVAKNIVNKFGRADIVVSSNTLAHIENMHDVAKAIKRVLKDDGILIFENHYLVNLLTENQYDMIYHEHQYYYSVMTLINFFNLYDMEIFNVEKIPVHAGSIRVFVQNKKRGKNSISKNVSKFLSKEKKLEIDKLVTYKKFEMNIKKNKNDILKLVISLKKHNKKIVGYGASGRGTVISNYCGLGNKFLEYVIDDSKVKQGCYTPGNHLEIYSSKTLLTDKPDYVILFAWSFIKEIKQRNKKYLDNGGKFIVPLPKVKIIT